ncbi:uncharacterized protein N7496_000572 [Penicillium cataractarum]|uniref:Uncharacterized protein n=1 Tax=Penicillium cataractarum TaxID=2100454 RepID=A0A9W9VUQ1_9EURO|nr:uncharacterized protein N7496_000572 [Penicillium cataractarum]KAJ5389504.1 hypothetical protein N7496_000572 [Penicillium cataractarum]
MSQPQPKKKQPTSTKPANPKPQTGWIWPKDPRPGNPTRWSRLKRFSDVLTGKGPDIYVGTIGKHPPARKDKDTPGRTVSSTNWARWDLEPKEEDTPFPWARRGKQEKYDYSTRKYGVPSEKTWSAVEYADCEVQCGKGKGKKKVIQTAPIRFWDRDGRVGRVGMVGVVGMEEIIVIVILIMSFMSMIRRWGALNVLMGMRILFGAIVLLVGCDGCF